MFKRNLSTLHIHLSSIPAQQTHLIGSTIPRNFGQGGGGFSTQVFDGVHNGINLLEFSFRMKYLERFWESGATSIFGSCVCWEASPWPEHMGYFDIWYQYCFN